MAFGLVMASPGCAPQVSSDTEGADGSSGGRDTTSGGEMTVDGWIAHCKALSTKEACEGQGGEAEGRAAYCAWFEWREILDEDACEFSDVVVSDCSAFFVSGEEGPSTICVGNAFPCRRYDLPFPAISVERSFGCGQYELCTADDPICDCACELGGG